MDNKKSKDSLKAAGAALGEYMRGLIPTSIVVGEVESINEEEKTIDAVVDDGRVFRDVSLDVFQDGGNSVLIFPAVGSLVVIGFIENFAETPVLLRMTAAETIVISNKQSGSSLIRINNELFEIIRGSSSWKIENNKVTSVTELTEFNGGTNDGMVLINELTSVLNNLGTIINNNNVIFAGHTHTYTWTAAAGAAVTAPPTSPMNTIPQFVKDDYENKDIIQ